MSEYWEKQWIYKKKALICLMKNVTFALQLACMENSIQNQATTWLPACFQIEKQNQYKENA